ncbi:hypothetical protein WN48_07472 [Eufriesea mexicana]|uniref:Uncharacterized protein n=1 Tax=Eufriesea mexicana TaxID=516756 RepID=A0A310SNE9_9HYME|nr:hypothetical protein WN48_07472 [Eufriesea mexicana]
MVRIKNGTDNKRPQAYIVIRDSAATIMRSGTILLTCNKLTVTFSHTHKGLKS